MSPAELRDYCLSFNGARETFPFGSNTSVFKVAGKMFALSQLGADSLRVSLKCEPQLAQALRETHAEILPGYHLNKRHWNTVIIDGSLPEQMLKDLIEDSYALVVMQLPMSRRQELESTTAAERAYRRRKPRSGMGSSGLGGNPGDGSSRL